MLLNKSLLFVILIICTTSCNYHHWKIDSKIDYTAYKNELILLSDNNLMSRLALRDSIIPRYGIDSKEFKAFIARMAKQDTLDVIKLRELEQKYGWATESKVGEEGANGAFLIIQHADAKTQRRYYPLFKKLYKKGEISKSNYALITDRILKYKRKKQLYGTQGDYLKINDTIRGVIYTIRNLSKIDKRRAKVGLRPFKEYLQDSHLLYDPQLKRTAFFHR
jgi:hypothetical protein